MKLLQKTFFGLMMIVGLLVSSLSTVDAGFTKSIVGVSSGSVHTQNDGSLVYKLEYINTTTGTETVRFLDTLPSGLVGGVAQNGICQGTPLPAGANGFFMLIQMGGLYQTNSCVLAPNQRASIEIPVTIAAGSIFSSITNTGRVEIYSGSTLISTGSSEVSFSSFPQVSITKTAQFATVQNQGDQIIFDITVTNTGAASVDGLMVTENIPFGFSYVSSTMPGTPSIDAVNNTMTWILPTLAARTSVTYQVVLSLATALPGANLQTGSTVTNRAVLSTGSTTTTGVSITTMTGQASFVLGAPNLVLNKTITQFPQRGLSGDAVMYTLSVSNTGIPYTGGWCITDTLPSQLSFLTGSLPTIDCNTSAGPGQVSFSGTNLPANITLTAVLNAEYASGTVITNTGSVVGLLSGLVETTMSDNMSGVSFALQRAPASFAITKSLTTPGSYISGSQYVFTIQVVNTGATAATGIVLQDILPSVLSYVSSTGSIEIDQSSETSNTSISSSPFTLQPGQTGNITITTALNTTLVTSGSYTNTATIDYNSTTYTGSTSFSVVPPVFSCDGFNLGLTINSPLQNPAGLTTLNGQNVTYNYVLTNNYAVPVEVVSLVPTWPTGIASPTPAFTSSVVEAGSGLTHSYTSTTIADGLTNLNAGVVATLRVGSGQTFTCTSNASLAISQTCGNGFINANLGEQCENHNGQVILAPGQTLDSSTQICNSACKIQTTVVRNCAKMIVNGVEKESCVNLDAQPEVPLLSMIKYVNGQDANTVANGVAAQSPNEVTYKVVITNNSPSIAYNVVFNDVVPNGVTYVNNSVSPTTITYMSANKTLAGNLGTIAPGASREVIFRATVDANAPTSVTNIATINYTDNTGTPKDPLSDPAVIVVSPSAPRCGDGRLDRLEQCDLGVRFGQSNVLIRDYLDTVGTTPSGIYDDGNNFCDAFCRIVDGNAIPVKDIPACRYTDSVISIMKDEYLPIAMELETNNLTNSCANNSSEGKVLESSISCTFKLYGPGDEANNTARLVKVYGNGCSDVLTTRNNVSGTPSFVGNRFTPRDNNRNKLFEKFSGSDGDPLFVENPRLTDSIQLTSQILGSSKPYGEYKLSLENIEYDYCQNNRPVRGTPYARVCRINVAVTDHYLMQRGSVSSLTNSRLEGYYDIGGAPIFEALDLDKIDRVSRLDYANLSTDMRTLTNNLITKYKTLAQTVSGLSLKKVPGKHIYYYDGDVSRLDLSELNLDKPATFIIDGNVTIYGSVTDNVMILATGRVGFGVDEPTSRSGPDSCETQTINGIIVAQRGFVATEGYKNDELNDHVRCRYGNLHVKGVLVGDDLENVVRSRRSHLEEWFTSTTNNRQENTERQNARRRDMIYEGASVYIEQNPSLWRSMPPEADSLLKRLNVARN